MVLVHLVQVDVVLVRLEQLLSDRGEVDSRVAELPFARGLHLGAEEAGDELVAETDAGEMNVGAGGP